MFTKTNLFYLCIILFRTLYFIQNCFLFGVIQPKELNLNNIILIINFYTKSNLPR